MGTSDRRARALVAALVTLAIAALLVFAPLARADHSSINSIDVRTLWTANVIAASGTATTGAFTVLGRSENQSVFIRGVGTSPNFKIEALTTLDQTTYVKPETGGDVITITDQNWHHVALGIPVSVAVKFKATELGASNSVAVDIIPASQ